MRNRNIYRIDMNMKKDILHTIQRKIAYTRTCNPSTAFLFSVFQFVDFYTVHAYSILSFQIYNNTHTFLFKFVGGRLFVYLHGKINLNSQHYKRARMPKSKICCAHLLCTRAIYSIRLNRTQQHTYVYIYINTNKVSV